MRSDIAAAHDRTTASSPQPVMYARTCQSDFLTSPRFLRTPRCAGVGAVWTSRPTATPDLRRLHCLLTSCVCTGTVRLRRCHFIVRALGHHDDIDRRCCAVTVSCIPLAFFDEGTTVEPSRYWRWWPRGGEVLRGAKASGIFILVKSVDSARHRERNQAGLLASAWRFKAWRIRASGIAPSMGGMPAG